MSKLTAIMRPIQTPSQRQLQIQKEIPSVKEFKRLKLVNQVNGVLATSYFTEFTFYSD
jgi:hypothetical protein